jgi:hypothetical protein
MRAAEPLKWKLEPGVTNHYQMRMNMAMTMNVPQAGEVKTSTDQIIDMSWTVEKVEEDGTAVLKQKIDRMRMEIGLPKGEPMTIDSASDKPPEGQAAMLAPLFKAMTSGEFTVHMKPSGEITEVEVPKAMIDALTSMPGAAMMGDMATEAGFKDLIKRSSLAIPEKLEPGVEWSSKVELKNPMTGPLLVENIYKYEGPREIDGKQYEVFKPTVKLSYGEGGATKIELQDQESDGEMLFDRTEGRLASSELKQSMTQKIGIGGQDMTQSIEQTVTMKWMSEQDAKAEAAEVESAEEEPATDPAK